MNNKTYEVVYDNSVFYRTNCYDAVIKQALAGPYYTVIIDHILYIIGRYANG